MIRVVFTGVDTLEASFRGDLSAELVDTLEAAKRRAQEEELGQPLTVGHVEFLVGPAGLKPWSYLLAAEDLHLRLSLAASIPTISARLLSLGLVACGHENLYGLAADLAEELGARPDGLSRLDLAVDFQGFVPTVAEMGHVVCNASFRPIYPNLENPETFQFGRGDIVVRVYNKTRELAQSGKSWFRTVWRQSEGYEESEDVWRFEVQLRRPALRALGSLAAPDAFARLDGLLGYALRWCSLRTPDGANRSRWPVHAAWEELGQAAFAGEPCPRVRPESYVASFRRTVPQALGLLVSGAAHLRVWDFDLALGLWKREMTDYIRRSDKDFATRVRERRRRLRRRLEKR
ncbi:MAG: hypothetical protein ACYC6T_05865 [Thermoleophilia bacterium]